jgi:hypothetical protein
MSTGSESEQVSPAGLSGWWRRLGAGVVRRVGGGGLLSRRRGGADEGTEAQCSTCTKVILPPWLTTCKASKEASVNILNFFL